MKQSDGPANEIKKSMKSICKKLDNIIGSKEIKCSAFGNISFIPESEGVRQSSHYLYLSIPISKQPNLNHVSQSKLNDSSLLKCSQSLESKPDNSSQSNQFESINEILSEILKDNWGMYEPKPPSLIMTVIGGAKNFKLDDRKKETFNLGLINAAKSTNAWIITSGFNMGVMKAVGDAVAEGQTYDWFSDIHTVTPNIKCIGITPFGYVEDRRGLIPRDAYLYNSVKYNISNKIESGKPVSLNPNHTHFIFIDDGSENKYFSVAEFRTNFEHYFSKQKNTNVVLILLEGGYEAIDEVYYELSKDIPVVICDGTGRAANIIAYYYMNFSENKSNPEFEKEIKQLLKNEFKDSWDKKSQDEKYLNSQVKKYYDIIVKCHEKPHLITVFNMDNDEELDLSILNLLLQNKKIKIEDKLNLAITWNRCKVAQDKIVNEAFLSNSAIDQQSIDEMASKIILDNKIDFLKLFLQNGVIKIDIFLTPSKLLEFYKSSQTNVLSLFLQKSEYSLVDVHGVIKKLLSRAYCNNTQIDENEKAKQNVVMMDHYKELFLWAILMNRHEMAIYFWEFAQHPVATALIGSWLNGAMADKLPHYESNLISNFTKNKSHFEKLAIDVLEESHKTDSIKASKIVQLKIEKWGNLSCLEIAAEADDKAFLSTVCCQNVFDKQWKRDIQSHGFKVFLAVLFLPLIMLIKFNKNTFQKAETNHENNLDTNHPDGEKSSNKNNLKIKKIRIKKIFDIIYKFYTTPITKFVSNLLSYLLFMFMYSWMLLFEFKEEKISFVELVIHFWISTLFLDELREMLTSSRSPNLIDRFKDWWRFSMFNRLDLIMFVLAFLGFISRFIIELHSACRVIYCINCCNIFISFLRFYSATSYLGPKILMISKMLRELFFFLLIYIIILLAYGVTTHSLMYPNTSFHPLIFRDLFYYGYWQLFGQLFLGEMQGATCKNGSQFDNIPWQACPNSSWLVYVLTAVYLLISNILLINILTATFNHVFDNIQANSIEIWRYGMYFLVVEYDNKPTLPPPIVIIEHIFCIGRFFFRYFFKETEDIVENQKEEDLLTVMEKECRKNIKVKEQGEDNLLKKIKNIQTIVEKIDHKLERNISGQRDGSCSGQTTPSNSRRNSLYKALNVGLSQKTEQNNNSNMMHKVVTNLVRTKNPIIILESPTDEECMEKEQNLYESISKLKKRNRDIKADKSTNNPEYYGKIKGAGKKEKRKNYIETNLINIYKSIKDIESFLHINN